MLYHFIFVIKAVIRALIGLAVHKPVHLILIQVNKTDIIVQIFIIYIINAGITIHIISPFPFNEFIIAYAPDLVNDII